MSQETQIKERPILFQGEMIRAILSGSKTQTRRVVKPQPAHSCHYEMNGNGDAALHLWTEAWNAKAYDKCFMPVSATNASHKLPCPFGKIGDRLWVRETWKCEELKEGMVDGVRFKADNHFQRIEDTRAAADAWVEAYRRDGKWRPSIFMPRWASRITLEITDVRVERIKDISREDCIAEGIERAEPKDGTAWKCYNPPPNNLVSGYDGEIGPYMSYASLWYSIHGSKGPNAFQANPWVWVISFKRIEGGAS